MSESSIRTEEARSRKQQKGDKLFAGRVKVHPMNVRGTFRRLKWAALGLLLAIYYLVPWIRWDRGPDAPNQAVLIDLPGRRAYFFFIEIWPQEVYYLTGLLILAAIGLFWITSLLGRVWCGYACPQTVWTDLFMLVERWIEGDHNARMKLDKQPTTGSKLAKRTAKHTVWIVIAAATGGAWVLYFKDAPTAVYEIFTLQASLALYGFAALFTATTYLLAGWAREQVCVYMCPWPRFQAAMFDEDTMVVTYESWRGEPRGKPKKGKAHVSPREVPATPASESRPGLAAIDWEKANELYGEEKVDGLGDCIACNKCVAVCPTGIDIRDGVQLECIGCALCIDACNDVMDRLNRPRNLITYDTLRNQDLRAQGLPPKLRLVRPRTVFYTLLLAVVAGAMLWSLAFRATLDINVLHNRTPLYVTLSDGDIRNGYTVRILNKTREDRAFTLSVAGLEDMRLSVVGAEVSPDQTARLTARPDTTATYRVHVTAPRESLDGTVNSLTFNLNDDLGETAVHDTVFRGPE